MNATKLDISGAVSIGKNVYIGDDVTIIVEQGAYALVLVITVLLVKVVISNVLAARLKLDRMSVSTPNRFSMAVVV